MSDTPKDDRVAEGCCRGLGYSLSVHRRAVPSQLAVSASLPSRENTALVTPALWHALVSRVAMMEVEWELSSARYAIR